MSTFAELREQLKEKLASGSPCQFRKLTGEPEARCAVTDPCNSVDCPTWKKALEISKLAMEAKSGN
jgi:hypothetical protein